MAFLYRYSFQQRPAAVQWPLKAFPSGYRQKKAISNHFPPSSLYTFLTVQIEGTQANFIHP
jgi:hypothetical protein